MSHPLQETAAHLESIFRNFGFSLYPGTEPSWVPISQSISEVPQLLDTLQRRFGGRNIAAAYLAMRYSGVTVLPLISAYLAEAKVPLATPDTAWIRCQSEEVFDDFAPGQGRMAVTIGDADAGHPDAVVVSPDQLAESLTEAIQVLVEPFLSQVRSHARFGLRGLWGMVADRVGGGTLALAREQGLDHRELWARADDILNRLAGRGMAVGNRSRALVVDWQGSETPFNIKGTCCLRYKAPVGDNSHHDADFPAGYCHSCPLVDEDVLQRHYRAMVQTAS